jgi:hypothetical protein
MNNNENQASDGEAKAKPELNKLGLDMQARQVTECRQLDGSTPKPAQNNLESYLRGNRDSMSIVAVPSPEQEQPRSVVRHREQLVRNRRRAEARGRAPVPDPGRPAAWKEFKTQVPSNLPAGFSAQLRIRTRAVPKLVFVAALNAWLLSHS